MNQVIIDESRWDKKKIAIGLCVGIFLIGSAFIAKAYFLDSNSSVTRSDVSNVSRLVEGAQTNKEDESRDPSTVAQQSSVGSFSSSQIQEQVQEKLEEVKKQVATLNISDIAQNSPQYQKVVSDLQNLQGLPKEEAKKACLNICDSLE